MGKCETDPMAWRFIINAWCVDNGGSIGVFVYLITDFTLLEGFLLGSIVSATDAAAVFSILRARSMG